MYNICVFEQLLISQKKHPSKGRMLFALRDLAIPFFVNTCGSLFGGFFGNIRSQDDRKAFTFDNIVHILAERTGRTVIVVRNETRSQMNDHILLIFLVPSQLARQIFELTGQAGTTAAATRKR